MAGLYIHIPFCARKCAYCSFVSFADRLDQAGEYLAALEREAGFYAPDGARIAPDTLYAGGGTPGLLSAERIEKLCAVIAAHFKAPGGFSESTFEANPETFTAEKIRAVKTGGFNRVSLGLQSFDDAVLKFLGRAHSGADFERVFSALRKNGFDNINADLITGVARRGKTAFRAELKRLAALKPEHISLYALSVEEGTLFHDSGVAPDDELARAEYDAARELLAAAGYEHYEISNFALPGRQSAHNMNYWRGGEYMGLGCSAASYLRGERTVNTAVLDEYLGAFSGGHIAVRGSICPSRAVSPAVRFHERLAGKAALGERIILGLRMLCGITVTPEMEDAFARQFEELEASGLLERTGHAVRLSSEGLYLSNSVFREFVEPF
ncbi:MAG: radical SAM family heme chaperone HemW [Elusimicrobiaceae bacterium]|nr:radical SAM family heme chaperone HemW [Elusimicrobiaceae bacterium]